MMNAGKHYLPPSPRSRHANKPKLSEQMKQTYSYDNSKRHCNSPNTFRSVDKYVMSEKNKDKENQSFYSNVNVGANLDSKNNLRHNHCQNRSYVNSAKDHRQIHNERKAIGVTQSMLPKYLCFQCSLYQARKGTKVTQITSIPHKSSNSHLTQKDSTINHNPPTNSLSYQHSLKIYIRNSTKLESALTLHYESIKKQLQNQQNTLQSLMQEQAKNLDTCIKQLKQKLEQKFKYVEQIINEENRKWGLYCEELEKYRNLLRLNKLDVLKNYEDCVFVFEAAEVEKILRLYSKQIEDSTSVLCRFSLEQMKKEYELRYQEVNDGYLKSDDMCKEFTFSKKRFQSPVSNSKLEGVPLIFSNYMSKRQRQTDHRSNLNYSNPKVQKFM